MKRTIFTLTLALSAAAVSTAASAQSPHEEWWQDGDTTLGLHLENRSFCAISAAPQGTWVMRGRLVDGRLVETDRQLARGRGAAAGTEPPEATDYFVQPTALVRRERSAEKPRGEFALFEPLAAAPSASVWLDLMWACSRDTEIEKIAESPRDDEARR
ncbi:hypothetical protein FSC37_14850 [Piscinibacter aquaticus]|uniref:DUF2147 domain-containing protein n=1 Tax=Piscinibacter aquaticus TaxID=392597 RepID=A0A5C6U176_9BURK|nr:hypothetical protein FSC37_14850 [Piscinibacter aquaticus]